MWPPVFLQNPSFIILGTPSAGTCTSSLIILHGPVFLGLFQHQAECPPEAAGQLATCPQFWQPDDLVVTYMNVRPQERNGLFALGRLEGLVRSTNVGSGYWAGVGYGFGVSLRQTFWPDCWCFVLLSRLQFLATLWWVMFTMSCLNSPAQLLIDSATPSFVESIRLIFGLSLPAAICFSGHYGFFQRTLSSHDVPELRQL